MDNKEFKKALLEAVDIEVENPGILEVPEGKKINQLPLSHFEKLVKKKGYAAVIKALTNLEVWNKKENKALSTWASNTSDKLRKKFRPESTQKNENKIKNDDVKDAVDSLTKDQAKKLYDTINKWGLNSFDINDRVALLKGIDDKFHFSQQQNEAHTNA